MAQHKPRARACPCSGLRAGPTSAKQKKRKEKLSTGIAETCGGQRKHRPMCKPALLPRPRKRRSEVEQAESSPRLTCRALRSTMTRCRGDVDNAVRHCRRGGFRPRGSTVRRATEGSSPPFERQRRRREKKKHRKEKGKVRLKKRPNPPRRRARYGATLYEGKGKRKNQSAIGAGKEDRTIRGFRPKAAGFWRNTG